MYEYMRDNRNAGLHLVGYNKNDDDTGSMVDFLSCKLYNKFLLGFMHFKKSGEHSKIMQRIFS